MSDLDTEILTIEDMAGVEIFDPHLAMSELRKYGPISNRAPMFPQEVPGLFSAIGFDAASEVLRDESRFNSSMYDATIGQLMGRTILSMAGDEHDSHRALVSSAFRQRALARWEPELIAPVVHGLIDEIAPKGRSDLVKELTFLFPVQVISRILGLAPEDYRKFLRWSVQLLAGRGTQGPAASRALRDYFEPIVEARRLEPADDLISDLVTADIDGAKLSDEAIYSFLRLLLPAGVETTFRATSNLLHLLLDHTDQLDTVRQDRSLLPQAIEEALRFEPPLLLIARSAVIDTEVAGKRIPKGSQVLVWLGGANRDPERWERPDEFDIHRPHLPHAAFGGGPHLCLGMNLARLEARVAVDIVLERLPGLRWDPSAERPRIRGNLFRSPPALPVAFDTA